MRNRSQAGFSLLELVVAFGILTVASAAIFLLSSATATGNTRGENNASSMQLAVEKIEELRNAGFNDVVSGSDTGSITAGGVSGGIYSRTWTVTSTTVADVPGKEITVEVSAVGGAAASLSTLLVQPRTLPGDPFNDTFPTTKIRSWDQIR